MVDAIATQLERRMAEVDYSGVVHVSRPGEVLFERARGLADRAHGVPHDVATRLAIASGTKAFTACAVMALVEEGRLRLATPVHDVLHHPCLEGVDRRVTVEHLLAHRSGIGDYLDESVIKDIEDYVLTIPVHRLATPTDYLTILGGHPPKFAPGEGFAYCNGGYVLLARVAEIASGESYYDLLERTVFRRAGMGQTALLRSDELPGSAAIGYLSGGGFRTNTLHMPLRGAGDGGAYASAGDIARFWRAFVDGRIVSPATVAEMIRTRSRVPEEGMRYGLGVWLHLERETLVLRGGDPGISFSTAYDLASGALYAAISNTTKGAWDMTPLLDELLFDLAASAPGRQHLRPRGIPRRSNRGRSTARSGHSPLPRTPARRAPGRLARAAAGCEPSASRAPWARPPSACRRRRRCRGADARSDVAFTSSRACATSLAVLVSVVP